MKGRISRALVSTSAHHNAATVGIVEPIIQLALSAAAATELLYHHRTVCVSASTLRLPNKLKPYSVIPNPNATHGTVIFSLYYHHLRQLYRNNSNSTIQLSQPRKRF